MSQSRYTARVCPLYRLAARSFVAENFLRCVRRSRIVFAPACMTVAVMTLPKMRRCVT